MVKTRLIDKSWRTMNIILSDIFCVLKVMSRSVKRLTVKESHDYIFTF